MTADEAKSVIEAAKKLLNRRDSKLGDTLMGLDGVDMGMDQAMNQAQRQVNEMDRQFADTEATIRVLQVDPVTGKETDVTNKVNPKDIQPEQIADMRSDTLSIPMGKDGKIDRDAARDLLSRIMTSSSYRPSQGVSPTTATAMKKMEVALAESDRLLKHFKE